MKGLVVLMAAVIAVVVIVVLVSGGGDDRRESKPAGTGAPESSDAGTKAPDRDTARATAGASKPTRAQPKTRPTLVTDPFATETRDPAWAGGVETELRKRTRALLDELPGDTIEITALECRTKRCRLRVKGTDSKTFQKLLVLMEGKRGFYGYAAGLTLKGFKKGAGDGSHAQVTVVLSFTR